MQVLFSCLKKGLFNSSGQCCVGFLIEWSFVKPILQYFNEFVKKKKKRIAIWHWYNEHITHKNGKEATK